MHIPILLDISTPQLKRILPLFLLFDKPAYTCSTSNHHFTLRYLVQKILFGLCETHKGINSFLHPSAI
jgi:hypothetical protein